MKKKTLSRMVGRVQDVQIGDRAKGAREKTRPVSILVQSGSGAGERFEWFSLGRQLRVRVKELVLGADEVIGHDFEFRVNENGEIEEFRRLLP